MDYGYSQVGAGNVSSGVGLTVTVVCDHQPWESYVLY